MNVLIIISILVSLTYAHEPIKYPPGVPSYQGKENNDIKFHDPADFKQQNPTPNEGAQHHDAHHSHSLRGNPSDHDKEHLKTHTQEEYVDVEKLSDAQMIMQHFRNYDLDKNGNIDGLEILKAAHRMNEDHGNPDNPSNIMDLVDDADETIKAYDDNDDGLINYREFYVKHLQTLQDSVRANHN